MSKSESLTVFNIGGILLKNLIGKLFVSILLMYYLRFNLREILTLAFVNLGLMFSMI